jgi:hypothetical protein
MADKPQRKCLTDSYKQGNRKTKEREESETGQASEGHCPLLCLWGRGRKEEPDPE